MRPEKVGNLPPPPLNPFATGNPFLGTKLLGLSIGRGSGVLKGLKTQPSPHRLYDFYRIYMIN